jgi:hypothetical protein
MKTVPWLQGQVDYRGIDRSATAFHDGSLVIHAIWKVKLEMKERKPKPRLRDQVAPWVHSATALHDGHPSNKEDKIRKERQETQATTPRVRSARSATSLETKPHAS